MCHRLIARDQLFKLTSWLHTNKPVANKVIGHIQSKLLGKFDCEVIVDSWPNPSAVLITTDKKHLQEADYLGNACMSYATDINKLDQLLEQENVFDWTIPSVFAGVSLDLAPVLKKHALKRGGLLQINDPCHLLHYDPTVADPPRKLHEDFKMSHLNAGDAKTLADLWKFSGPRTTEYVEHLIAHFPSVAARQRHSGRLAAWVLTQHYWALGMAYVNPEYRRRGLGHYLTSCLLQQLHSSGHLAYTFVEEANHASLKMMSQLGLVSSGVRVAWLRYEPSETALINHSVPSC